MSLPTEEMIFRRESLQGAMVRANLEHLVVYSSQIKPEPVHYLTNYNLLGEWAICYLPLEGKPVFFISEDWDRERAARVSGLEEVRLIGENWAQEVAAIIGGDKKHVGVVGRENLGWVRIESLEAALGQKTVSATALLEDVAMIKSPYELSLIRQASKMADAGFFRALSVVKEGLTDYELVAEIDYVMRQMGATDNFQMIAIGKQNSGMLLPCGKRIAGGDHLLFEITPANGSVTYSAQLCRTAIFGEAPDRILQDKYSIMSEALEESLANIKPGVGIAEVAKVQNRIIGNAGYSEYCKPPYMRARGHGFGLGRIDVKDDSTVLFTEGMSLVVHPNQFIPEIGYLAIGEHILITGKGFERLTQTENKIYECGGACS